MNKVRYVVVFRRMAKSNALNIRFDASEAALLDDISKKSGLSVSEVVRRSVSLLNQEVTNRGGKFGWILDDLGPDSKMVLLSAETYKTALARAKLKHYSSFSDYVAYAIGEEARSAIVAFRPTLPFSARVAEDPAIPSDPPPPDANGPDRPA